MARLQEKINDLIFNKWTMPNEQNRFIKRFTQSSPISPDIWRKYSENINERIDLIFIPLKNISSGLLLIKLKESLLKISGDMSKWELATNGEVVVAKLTIKELINGVLIHSFWWQNNLEKTEKSDFDLIWLKNIITNFNYYLKIPNKINVKELTSNKFKPSLWSISLNRKSFTSINESIPTTNSDSATRLFDVDCSNLIWAVFDSGIDARHHGFRKNDNPIPPNDIFENSRIIRSYDFTKFRSFISEIFNSQKNEISEETKNQVKSNFGFTNDLYESFTEKEQNDIINEINLGLKNGRILDWSLIEPYLRIQHNSTNYLVPQNSHGTHVAGIIGSNFKENNLTGICPNISLYDIRVIGADGNGDEFTILAALQFIRWVNNQSYLPTIQGINISISILHQFDDSASGKTPVCDACQKIVSEGTVVVVSAGNQGQNIGNRTSSITDPGNTETVITVGSTHKCRPNTFGVSYFSSKGPTIDGRSKPDLVAPGEKIKSLIPNNGTQIMDGTSMAAPHVSGAAALLMAKNRELIGQPQKIKDILCITSTDLGRDRYFQGAGMLDVLKALQSI